MPSNDYHLMGKYQVIGIRKLHSQSANDEITHIAYEESFFNPKVVITIEEAVARIGLNKEEFFIKSTNHLHFIAVVLPEDSKPFIKSVLHKERDRLLALQSC